nr:solute carrier organic anion transporter family member 3A1-like [Leptinotarsa decemlineata]XP_023019009.1 solute carrier organic anion transporter family member 3A1-like [Leptinotarsa decemlineata]
MTTEEEHLENHRMLEKSSNNNELPEERTILTQPTRDFQHKTECNRNLRDDESEPQCGIGPCTSNWLQRFASKQAFLFVFCIAWVLQGMYHTYFVSAITTIEKLFQIQSKVTGIIMSATEIGQIGSSLLLTYYGGHGHRPKWIAFGMILFAVSSLTCSLPHFIYGIEENEISGIANDPNVCKINNGSDTSFLLNDAVDITSQGTSKTNIVLAIFFISLLGVGMGQTAVYTLGIPYIDDNVASKESPIYFAITIGVRIVGPALGFIVGSLCTSVYADLSVDPKIDSTDPRWVGAWWLGLVVIAGLLMLASLAMFMFPKRLPGSNQQPRVHDPDKKHPSIRDFPKTVKRLLKNDILMYRTASTVLHILPIAGLYTFLPKYLETQFRLPTPSANMISGLGGILVMGLGIIISGVFILRVKPNARFVAAWIALTAVIYAIGMGILMFIGCPSNDLAGLKDNAFDVSQLNCNEDICDCEKYQFSPICGEDGKTYLSPCHAGCKNYTEKDGKIVHYSDCVCLDPSNTTLFNNSMYGNATLGYCDLQCDSFVLYIILFSFFVFVHSTSEVGSMLLILRCVDPKDKAMALGLIQFAIGLFGNVPCPIIYGAVVDSACLVWKMASGETGACGLYNSDMFRMFFHGTTGAIMLMAFFVDVIVWYKAGSINFADEQGLFEEELHTITEKKKSEPE